MSAAILQVSQLRKVYPGHRGAPDVVAVDDVSFSVPSGGSLAVVGESGSGKTTTARIVLGLERPTSGEVQLAGVRLSYGRLGRRERRSRARVVQMVFQDPYSSLDPRQTIRGAIDEVLALHHTGDERARRHRIGELAEQVGLDERQLDSYPRHLSGGQRQRATIARALAVRPALIVLDEAVASLDVSIQAQILNLLDDIRRTAGIAYLLISHDLAVVRQLCDSAAVMQEGRLVESGPVSQVLEAPQHPYTRRLRDSVPRVGWDPEAILRAR